MSSSNRTKHSKPNLLSTQATIKTEKRKDEEEHCKFVSNFTPVFNGFQCHFLKKENYEVLKLFTTATCITSNESIAIFRMPAMLRRRIVESIDNVLQLVKHDESQQLYNPFKVENDTPVFVRIAPTTLFFLSSPIGPLLSQRSEFPTGKNFCARVAVTLKGAKVDRSGKNVSPMLVTNQIMMIEKHKAESNRCILDEPLCDEDVELPSEDGAPPSYGSDVCDAGEMDMDQ